MRGLRIIFSALPAVFLASCSMFDSAPTIPMNPFAASSRPEEAVTQSSSAIRSGRILMQDRSGYRKVFGSDNFRFGEKNLHPVSISIYPYNDGYSCSFLVADSFREDGSYDLVTVSGKMDGISVPAVTYAGKSDKNRTSAQNPVPVLPEPSVIAAACEAVQRRIQNGEISWVQDGIEGITAPSANRDAKDASLLVVPDDLWERERLNAVNRTLRFAPKDLALCEISALPEHRILLTYAVIPLIERISENTVSMPKLEIPVDYNGNLSGRIASSGANQYLDVSTVQVNPFSQKESEDIYETAFCYVLNGQVPMYFANLEKIRFISLPPSVSDEFPARFRNDALPARNPQIRDWSLKLPYQDRVGYTSQEDGAFYYSAGPIRIVDRSNVYIRIYLRHKHPLENRENRMHWYLKLKKGLFGWSVSGNEWNGSGTSK